jgi:N-acyl-D-aspartate/D-glutamate deacylase
MSAEALACGIDWSFETFPEYLDALARRPLTLNVAAFVGHSPLRIEVLGDQASDRAATPAEIHRLRALATEALRAGALGIATSKVAVQNGASGKPVPSRLADWAELSALAEVLRTLDVGLLEVATGPGVGDEQLVELAHLSGRPLCTFGSANVGALERLDSLAANSISVQVPCRPLVFQVTMLDPFPLGVIPAFQDVLACDRDRRAKVYSDPDWRRRAREGFDRLRDTAPQLSRFYVDETAVHSRYRGRSVIELAAELGTHPIDLLVDLALAEDLRTRFRVVFGNDDASLLAELLVDERTVVGLSDAGAHASQICDAVFSTSLLEEWVRERDVLSLEQAVRHLTSHPAEVFGLARRGSIVPGYFADLVAFDPATVGPQPTRRVCDLPGGADRLLADSRGIHHVWVNGVAIRNDGIALDLGPARPGRVVRGPARRP